MSLGRTICMGLHIEFNGVFEVYTRICDSSECLLCY